jgi:transcriptional regulator GlxA family with amidase domain
MMPAYCRALVSATASGPAGKRSVPDTSFAARHTPSATSDGVRGLADARLAPAIRQMHAQLARQWTVVQLAKTAALSRSTFFERFTRTVGLPPMEYLLAWRMAIARDLLRRRDVGIADVAERVARPRLANRARGP